MTTASLAELQRVAVVLRESAAAQNAAATAIENVIGRELGADPNDCQHPNAEPAGSKFVVCPDCGTTTRVDAGSQAERPGGTP